MTDSTYSILQAKIDPGGPLLATFAKIGPRGPILGETDFGVTVPWLVPTVPWAVSNHWTALLESVIFYFHTF